MREDLHYLVIDFYGSGHHSQYLSYVVRFWNEQRPGARLTLCCVQEVFDQNPSLLREIEESNSGIHLRLLSEYEKVPNDSTRSMIRNDRIQGSILTDIVSEFRPDEVILMQADYLLLALGGRKVRFPFGVRISGIYFRPSLSGAGVGSWLRRLRKRFVLRRAMLNPHVSRILSLDPRVDDLQRRWKLPPKLVAIADPVDLPESQLTKEDAKQALGIDPKALVLLVFGSIDERKGIDVAVESLHRLKPNTDLSLVIAGPIAKHYREVLTEMTEHLPPNVAVTFLDRFLVGDQISRVLRAADVVLVLYRNHVGSSNVLVWAAQAGVPVISSDTELIGHTVKLHGLGQAVDISQAKPVDRAMSRALEDPESTFDSHLAASFAATNSVDEFGRVLFHK